MYLILKHVLLFRFVEIIKCSLFSALNCIPQTVAQSVARERSSEIREHISWELQPVLNIEVSSANIEHSLGIDRGRSYVYIHQEKNWAQDRPLQGARLGGLWQ